MFVHLYCVGTALAQIRRSRSESHSDAYDADEGEDLFIPRSARNGKHVKFLEIRIIHGYIEKFQPVETNVIKCNLFHRIFRP